MVEIQSYGFIAYCIDAGIHGLALLVLHLEFGTNFHRDFFWKLLPGHIHKGFVIFFAISIRGSHYNIFAITDSHANHLAFQPGNDISRAVYVFQGFTALRCICNFTIYFQRIFHRNDVAVIYL